jgi:acetyl esterase/lipase
MKNISYTFRIIGTVLGVILKRIAGHKKQPDWSFQTEMMWATTRLTLLSSQRYGLPWLKKLSNSFKPKPQLKDSVSTTQKDNQAGSYLELKPLTKDNSQQRIIIYFHGGGYVTGNPFATSAFTTRIADRTPSTVLVPFYPTAPEHTYPTAHRFAVTFTASVISENQDAEIILAGDSAGGALVISSFMSLKGSSREKIKACILISPWVDPLAAGGSIKANADNDVGDRDFVVACHDLYLQGQKLQDAFPLTFTEQNLPQLPPTFLSVGSVEILLDQTQTLAKDLQQKGTHTSLKVYKGMFHTFWNMVPGMKAGEQLIEDIAEWMNNLD